MAKKKKSGIKGWEIGAGITAAAVAAAAGAYLLSDKKTKTKAKKWVADARKEVARNAKIAKKLGEKDYARLVDKAVKHYGSLKKMTVADMLVAGKDLKAEWKHIQREAKKMGKMKAPKKPAKKKAAPRKKKARV